MTKLHNYKQNFTPNTMVRYQVHCEQAQQRYIQFSAVFEQDAALETLQLELPSWRPGRYEIGNFAKNIKGFNAYGEANQSLAVRKTTKDTWIIDTKGSAQIKITYSYYAAELNAGSTFLDPKQLYVNPVNCFFTTPPKPNKPTNSNCTFPQLGKLHRPYISTKTTLAKLPILTVWQTALSFAAPTLNAGVMKLTDALSIFASISSK